MKLWGAPPGLEMVYSNIDCMSGQPSVKAAEVVARKIWAALPGLEMVYSIIDCMSGQPSVKAAEIVAGTSKDENLGSTSRPGNGLQYYRLHVRSAFGQSSRSSCGENLGSTSRPGNGL